MPQLTITGEKVWTKEEIKGLLTKPLAIRRGVVAIYKLQTDIEKNAEQTIEHNGVGFNAFDADVLSDIAKKLIAGQELTDKEYFTARKRIQKYAGQLTRIANKEIRVD